MARIRFMVFLIVLWRCPKTEKISICYDSWFSIIGLFSDADGLQFMMNDVNWHFLQLYIFLLYAVFCWTCCTYFRTKKIVNIEHIIDSFNFFKKFRTQCHQIENMKCEFSKCVNYVFVNKHLDFWKKFASKIRMNTKNEKHV